MKKILYIALLFVSNLSFAQKPTEIDSSKIKFMEASDNISRALSADERFWEDADVKNKTELGYIKLLKYYEIKKKTFREIYSKISNPADSIKSDRKYDIKILEVLTEALTKYPQNEDFHSQLIEVYYTDMKDYESCIIACNNATHLGGTKKIALAYHFKSLFRLKRYSEAITASKSYFLEKTNNKLFIPLDRNLHYYLANCYFKVDSIENSISELRKFVDISQGIESADTLILFEKQAKEVLKEIIHSLNNQSYEINLSALKYLNELEPINDIELLNRKAKCEESLGLHSDAVSTISLILNKSSEPETYLMRGIQYYNLRKYNEALADFNIALTNKNLNLTYEWRGLCYYFLDKPNEAISDLNTAIATNPNNSANYYYRASAKYDLKQYQDAINDYEKAIELGEKSGNIFFMNGYSNYLTNQFESSILNYSKAIEIDPKNAKYLAYRGRARFKLNQFESAIEDVNKAFEINDPKIQPFTLRGDCLFELKKYNEALNDYEKSISMSPENNKNALNGKEKVLKVLQEMKK